MSKLFPLCAGTFTLSINYNISCAILDLSGTIPELADFAQDNSGIVPILTLRRTYTLKSRLRNPYNIPVQQAHLTSPRLHAVCSESLLSPNRQPRPKSPYARLAKTLNRPHGCAFCSPSLSGSHAMPQESPCPNNNCKNHYRYTCLNLLCLSVNQIRTIAQQLPQDDSLTQQRPRAYPESAQPDQSSPCTVCRQLRAQSIFVQPAKTRN